MKDTPITPFDKVIAIIVAILVVSMLIVNIYRLITL
jgi:hypothetical protein